MPASSLLLPLLLRLRRDAGPRWSRRYEKGAFIFEEGDAPEAVYLLVQGLVKLIKYSPRSEPFTMEIVAPGGLFGLVAVMDKKPYPVGAQALQAVDAYRIPSADFQSLMAQNPAFAQEAFRQLGEHVRHSQQLRSLSKEPVEKRFAFLLNLLHESMGPDLRMRREDLAEMIGSTPETAVRVLNTFRKKKWITAGWKRITVLEPGALARLAENTSIA